MLRSRNNAQTTPDRYAGIQWNSRARHILSQGMLLKALTTSSGAANATQPRRSAPSTRERTRATASAIDRPLRKLNWLSCSPESFRDKCDSRRAATTFSSSLPASSKRLKGGRRVRRASRHQQQDHSSLLSQNEEFVPRQASVEQTY